MIKFVEIDLNEPPHDLYMDDGKYVWRDWWPRTERQCQVANAAYAYLAQREIHAEKFIVLNVRWIKGMWCIDYSLEFGAINPIVDVMYLSPDKVNEILVENER